MHPLIAALVVALTVWGSSYHIHPRPHLINIALIAWTFARLCDFEAGRVSLRSLFWLVPLFALWANIHGGMVGGVVTIAAASAGWGLAKLVGHTTAITCYRQLLWLGVLVVACGLTAFLNPYGSELPRVWFWSCWGRRSVPLIIQEHFSLVRAGPVAWSVVLFAGIYLGALLGVPPRQVRVTWLLPLLWFAMTWSRIRHGPLFVITAALALGEMYPQIRWREWLVRKGSVTLGLQADEVDNPWKLAVFPGLLVLAAVALQAAAVRVPVLGRGWAHLDPGATPVALLPELREYEADNPTGRADLQRHALRGFSSSTPPPRLKVFVDDRCELYGDDWLVNYSDAYYHHPERIEGWARERGFDRALVIPDTVFDRYLHGARDWSEVRRSEGAVLYRRSPQPAPDAG